MDPKPFLWNNYPEHKYPSPTSVAADTVCAPVTPHQASWNAYQHPGHPYSLADSRHVTAADTFHPDYTRLSQYPPESLYTHPPHGQYNHSPFSLYLVDDVLSSYSKLHCGLLTLETE